jgi:LemA protein
MAATGLVGLTITGGGMIVLVTAVTAVAVGGILALAYNRLVRRQNLVKEGSSGIDVQLKRRHDLVPNLIACVQGYASFERSILEDVIRLRTAADTATTMAEINLEENRLTAGLKSLFAVAEAYPDLKANANFAQLSTQLVEIEDALQYSRRYYNGAVRDLNIAVESFPSNLVAGWFGFPPADYFEVESIGERAVPRVSLEGPS